MSSPVPLVLVVTRLPPPEPNKVSLPLGRAAAPRTKSSLLSIPPPGVSSSSVGQSASGGEGRGGGGGRMNEVHRDKEDRSAHGREPSTPPPPVTIFPPHPRVLVDQLTGRPAGRPTVCVAFGGGGVRWYRSCVCVRTCVRVCPCACVRARRCACAYRGPPPPPTAAVDFGSPLSRLTIDFLARRRPLQRRFTRPFVRRGHAPRPLPSLPPAFL